ncbi:MAG TPA: glycosyltransferase [Casimicrobiaceae bacterium]|nr:glycosyltransferase [Casimicrobiaceae bacterium]
MPIGAHCTPLALFMGSSHMPNVHAARFLIEEVAPSVPEIVIGLIGSVCDAVRLLPRPRNVALFGVVSDDEKAMLLRRASIALNPLQSGGGSSLKVPDFLAAGLPMLSSDIGVRGYALVNDQHYLRAGSSDFVDRLRALSRDRSLREKLARAGQMFALCHWDWEVLGRRYANALTPLTGVSPRVRVLVTTYRFAIPPPGGAESFLLNVLRNFGRSDALDVDVAACDVGKIVNKWHFSATYSTAETAIDRPDFLSALRYFAVDPPALDDFSDCSRLFHSWMAESREQAQALKDELRQPMLMGGWNFAETHAGKPGRWTSLESCIFVGECADGLRVDGYVPSRTTLTIQSGDSIAGERVIDGTFSLQIDLAGHDGSASLLISSPIVAQEDPRELGAFVSHVAVRRCGEWSSIDLASDFETFMRGQNQERWIESLMKVTSRREASVDGVFVKVRGPHSRALDRWLEGHIGRYDVVIAHGVPFATSTRTTQIASTHGVPVVVLPHFHSEDRYYHWQSFYAMFRAAACVIAAPASSKPMFLDKLPARTVIVRGGGIDLAEFEEARLRSHQNAFLAVHSSLRPFVLVLGRKAAGKNYRMVVAAVDSINRQSHRVDLVIIGPEDDHVPVASPTTHYYGEQPRNVVLGALALSLCLANMSTSESFGIVLLEAWASGRPVIARRNCAAFAELVEHGRNGVLANSVAEVADAVATYLADSALAARHGEAGRSDCQAYAWSRIAHDLENVIVDVAAAHRMRTESGE